MVVSCTPVAPVARQSLGWGEIAKSNALAIKVFIRTEVFPNLVTRHYCIPFAIQPRPVYCEGPSTPKIPCVGLTFPKIFSKNAIASFAIVRSFATFLVE
jgi:hypothetical protein